MIPYSLRLDGSCIKHDNQGNIVVPATMIMVSSTFVYSLSLERLKSLTISIV